MISSFWLAIGLLRLQDRPRWASAWTCRHWKFSQYGLPFCRTCICSLTTRMKRETIQVKTRKRRARLSKLMARSWVLLPHHSTFRLTGIGGHRGLYATHHAPHGGWMGARSRNRAEMGFLKRHAGAYGGSEGVFPRARESLLNCNVPFLLKISAAISGRIGCQIRGPHACIQYLTT